MKFLCLHCDHVMDYAERRLPGDGTLAVVFACGRCGREIAMLTNPMETQLVSSLGVKVGGREVPDQPLELVRSHLADGHEHAFADEAQPRDPAGDPPTPPARVVWDDAALDRLALVPSFVRGMVKRIYTDYARDRGIARVTPAMMDRARMELGLEGM